MRRPLLDQESMPLSAEPTRRAMLSDEISERTGITEALIAKLINTFYGRVPQAPCLVPVASPLRSSTATSMSSTGTADRLGGTEAIRRRCSHICCGWADEANAEGGDRPAISLREPPPTGRPPRRLPSDPLDFGTEHGRSNRDERLVSQRRAPDRSRSNPGRERSTSFASACRRREIMSAADIVDLRQSGLLLLPLRFHGQIRDQYDDDPAFVLRLGIISRRFFSELGSVYSR